MLCKTFSVVGTLLENDGRELFKSLPDILRLDFLDTSFSSWSRLQMQRIKRSFLQNKFMSTDSLFFFYDLPKNQGLNAKKVVDKNILNKF